MPAKKQFEEDVARTRIENVATAEIRTDQLVQPRAHLNPNVIAEYSDLMTNGHEFPPVGVVLVDDKYYLLWDGFLRFEAAKLANQETMRCEVRRGDLRTAMLLSAQANAQHGLRRTNEDKRRAVGKLLNDAEWSKWSDREIGRLCSVSHDFVGQQRGQLTGDVASERRFVTKHGSEATMNIVAIGKKTLSPAPIILTASPSSSPETLGEVVLTAPSSSSETSGEVVVLSDIAQDYREQFVAVLRQIEKSLAGLPAITLIRGDPGEDAVLAKRWTWVAEKATATARMILRRE